MKPNIPTWALTEARPDDYPLVRDGHGPGRARIRWASDSAVRAWAKQRGWPTPWFGFEQAFIAKLLEDQEHFALALAESGIEVHLLKRDHMLSAEHVSELDALYAERSPDGRPSSWGVLVEELRAVRRAIEAGVVVSVEGGPTLGTWSNFYDWAHGRYHMLEDGYDSWIGDDAS